MAERGVLLALNGLLKGINSGLARRDEREEKAKDRALKEKEFTLKEENAAAKDLYYQGRLEDQERRTDILAEKLGIDRTRVNTQVTDKTDANYSRLQNEYTSLQASASKEDDKIKEDEEELNQYKKRPEKYKDLIDSLSSSLEGRKQRRNELNQKIKDIDTQMKGLQRKAPKGQKGAKASKIESFNAVKTLQMIESLDDPEDILNALDENDFSIHNANEREELKKIALQKILGGQKVAAGQFYQGPQEGMPSTGRPYDDAVEEMNEAVDKIKIHKPGDKSRKA